jgi:DNA replication protein DnaC
MLLYNGSVGIGKTFFCSALVDWAVEYFRTVRYHDEKEVLRQLRSMMSEGGGDYAQALNYMFDDEVIFLDDIGSGINPGKYLDRDIEWRTEVLFTIIDLRYVLQLPTILTTNFSREIFSQVFGDRVASRVFAAENTIVSVFDDAFDKRKQGF